MNDQSAPIEQYDYIEDEYFDKAITKYSSLIGMFFMNFSYLEHELDIAIAEIVSDRNHSPGYLFITKIDRMSDKIDLFYKYFKNFEHTFAMKTTRLKTIQEELIKVNEFRNSLAHAKWQTIQKDGKIRVKIKSDRNTGIIQSKNTIIKPKDIRLKIKTIHKIIYQIDIYLENIGKILWNK